MKNIVMQKCDYDIFVVCSAVLTAVALIVHPFPIVSLCLFVWHIFCLAKLLPICGLTVVFSVEYLFDVICIR